MLWGGWGTCCVNVLYMFCGCCLSVALYSTVGVGGAIVLNNTYIPFPDLSTSSSLIVGEMFRGLGGASVVVVVAAGAVDALFGAGGGWLAVTSDWALFKARFIMPKCCNVLWSVCAPRQSAIFLFPHFYLHHPIMGYNRLVTELDGTLRLLCTCLSL